MRPLPPRRARIEGDGVESQQTSTSTLKTNLPPLLGHFTVSNAQQETSTSRRDFKIPKPSALEKHVSRDVPDLDHHHSTDFIPSAWQSRDQISFVIPAHLLTVKGQNLCWNWEHELETWKIGCLEQVRGNLPLRPLLLTRLWDRDARKRHTMKVIATLRASEHGRAGQVCYASMRA
jgi:hypothetical protein